MFAKKNFDLISVNLSALTDISEEYIYGEDTLDGQNSDIKTHCEYILSELSNEPQEALNLGGVSNRRELLIAFNDYLNKNSIVEVPNTQIEDLIEEVLSNL